MARPRSPFVVIGAVAAALVAVAWRFLTFTGFSNDHYVHVALAQQLLLGERPIRDFLDPGLPLMYLLSVGAQLVGGARLGTEFAVVGAAFAVAAAITLAVAHRLAASLAVAVLITMLEVLAYPRSYSYPKLLAYAIASYTMLAVAERPARRRIVLLALSIVIAFLFRHDHGLYVGVAAAVCVALASRAQGWRIAVENLAVLAAATGAFVLPWILFVEINGGLVSYLRAGVEFSRAEAVATMLHYRPGIHLDAGQPLLGLGRYAQENAEAWLFWVFWTLPLVCAAILFARLRRGRERWHGEAALVGALIVMASLVNAGFLRDTLRARLPDAIVPVALLGAWLHGLVWTERWSHPTPQHLARIASVVLVVTSAAAFAVIADVRQQLERSGISNGIDAVSTRYVDMSNLLAHSHRQDISPSSRYAEGLMPFFAYLDRCTSRADRIVLTSLMPEVLVLAERGFGGGTLAFIGSYQSQEEQAQARTIERLRAQPALFALTIDNYESFRHRFARIDAYLTREYERMVDIPVEGTGPPGVRVLVKRDRPVARIDPDTGWRCFR